MSPNIYWISTVLISLQFPLGTLWPLLNFLESFSIVFPFCKTVRKKLKMDDTIQRDTITFDNQQVKAHILLHLSPNENKKEKKKHRANNGFKCKRTNPQSKDHSPDKKKLEKTTRTKKYKKIKQNIHMATIRNPRHLLFSSKFLGNQSEISKKGEKNQEKERAYLTTGESGSDR